MTGLLTEESAIRATLRRIEQSVRLAERDPLDRLQHAIDRLESVFGLYAAPALLAMRETLDPDEHDDAEEIQHWTGELTRAIWAVLVAYDVAYSPEAIGARQDALTHAERREHRLGYNQGRVRGRAQERAECFARHGYRPRTTVQEGTWSRCTDEPKRPI